MSTQSATIVQRLWNYCNVLRDDGVSYGDYVEQLTYLFFLKMDDEQAQLLDKPSAIPVGLAWQSLTPFSGDELEAQYRRILAELGHEYVGRRNRRRPAGRAGAVCGDRRGFGGMKWTRASSSWCA